MMQIRKVVFVLTVALSSVSAGKEKQGLGTIAVRLDTFASCLPDAPIYLSDMRTDAVSSDIYSVSGYVNVNSIVEPPYSGSIEMLSCKDNFQNITCKRVVNYEFKDICGKLFLPGEIYSGLISKVQLDPRACPILPGKYAINNYVVEDLIARKLKLLQGHWKIFIKGFEGKEKNMTFCNEVHAHVYTKTSPAKRKRSSLSAKF